MESISIFLSNTDNLRPGKKVKARIAIEWANYFRTEYSVCNRKSPFPLDSVQLFLNKKPFFDCRMILPDATGASEQTVTLSVIWRSKPWLNDIKVYALSSSRRTIWTLLPHRRKETGVKDE